MAFSFPECCCPSGTCKVPVTVPTLMALMCFAACLTAANAGEECALYHLYENRCDQDSMYHTLPLTLGKLYSRTFSTSGIPITVDAVWTCNNGHVTQEVTTLVPGHNLTQIHKAREITTWKPGECNPLNDMMNDHFGQWKKYEAMECGPCCAGDVPESCGDTLMAKFLRMNFFFSHSQLLESLAEFARSKGLAKKELQEQFRELMREFCHQSQSNLQQCCDYWGGLWADVLEPGCFALNPHNPQSDPTRNFDQICPAVAEKVRAQLSNSESIATCSLTALASISLGIGVTVGATVTVCATVLVIALWRWCLMGPSTPARETVSAAALRETKVLPADTTAALKAGEETSQDVESGDEAQCSHRAHLEALSTNSALVIGHPLRGVPPTDSELVIGHPVGGAPPTNSESIIGRPVEPK